MKRVFRYRFLSSDAVFCARVIYIYPSLQPSHNIPFIFIFLATFCSFVLLFRVSPRLQVIFIYPFRQRFFMFFSTPFGADYFIHMLIVHKIQEKISTSARYAQILIYRVDCYPFYLSNPI